MKLAGFPKSILVSTLAGALLLALSGCGTVAKNNNLSLTSGNWSIAATSTMGNGPFSIGGNITQTGTAVSANLHVTGSLCFDPSATIAFTGDVSGNKITLTSATFQSQVITVAATGTSGSALSGTYIVAGGCANGDAGTISANLVPAINGNWAGPINDSNDNANAAITITGLTQATSASPDGTFALTGTAVTYTNSMCSLSGTISGGSVAGSYVTLTINTVEFDNSTAQYLYQFVKLNSATAPTSMTGEYVSSTGICPIDNPAMTLTKQ